MPNIIFTKPDGSEHIVTVENGVTVMEAGRDAGLGIEGTCGGCLSCATCHVFVDPEWLGKVAAVGDFEDAMLDATEVERTDASRLSCQIEVSNDMDGLVVNMPESQH